jgi:hypothetical protein
MIWVVGFIVGMIICVVERDRIVWIIRSVSFSVDDIGVSIGIYVGNKFGVWDLIKIAPLSLTIMIGY